MFARRTIAIWLDASISLSSSLIRELDTQFSHYARTKSRQMNSGKFKYVYNDNTMAFENMYDNILMYLF